MWRDGGAGEGSALLEFYSEVCMGNILKVNNFSYRSSRLPTAISHLKGEGELELSVENSRLFGTFRLISIDEQQSYKDKLTEEKKKILLEAVNKQSRLWIDAIQNYQPSGRVSLYSGDPTFGESWSFHCLIPQTRTVAA